MIGPVRDRATFEALRRRGRRVRRGPVTVVYLPAQAPPPRAAFAIGRSVGNAVVRNRVRRRLRSVLHDMDAGRLGGPSLAPGTYLLSTRPGVVTLSYADLAGLVSSACAAVVEDREGSR
ncbi:MAG: ribonuclease P protein component [Acidimicrobiales bacterium]